MGPRSCERGKGDAIGGLRVVWDRFNGAAFV